MKEYIEVWQSTFDLKERLSRRKFLLFWAINYTGLLVLGFIFGLLEYGKLFFYLSLLIRVIILFALLSAGMRRMNDIGRPISFVFIPFYSIYLCLLPSSEKETVVNPNRIKSFSKIFKFHLVSTLIGVISFITIAQLDFGGGYGALFVYLMVIVICVIVLPIIITSCILFLHDIKKEVITPNYLLIAFLIIGVLTIILINICAYSVI